MKSAAPRSLSFIRGRAVRRHSLERDTPLVALAAARQVVAEAERWLGVQLPAGEAERLAGKARTAYARSEAFRRKLARRADDADRETLYAFLRHWLTARLNAEAPACFARLPPGYAWGGEDLPEGLCPEAAHDPLSVEARGLLLV